MYQELQLLLLLVNVRRPTKTILELCCTLCVPFAMSASWDELAMGFYTHCQPRCPDLLKLVYCLGLHLHVLHVLADRTSELSGRAGWRTRAAQPMKAAIKSSAVWGNGWSKAQGNSVSSV